MGKNPCTSIQFKSVGRGITFYKVKKKVFFKINIWHRYLINFLAENFIFKLIFTGVELLYCKTEIDTDVGIRHMSTKGERWGGGELGDWDWHIYIIDTMYK